MKLEWWCVPSEEEIVSTRSARRVRRNERQLASHDAPVAPREGHDAVECNFRASLARLFEETLLLHFNKSTSCARTCSVKKTNQERSVGQWREAGQRQTMIPLEIQKLSPVPTRVSKEVGKVQIRHFLIELSGKR